MSFIQSFPLDKPKDSLDAILKRLKNGALLDQECALYFKERAAIELKYAADLEKLSKRQITSKIEPNGVFGDFVTSLNRNAIEVATHHREFASKLESNIELPLKSRCDSDAQWAKVKLGASNLNKNYGLWNNEAAFVKSTKDYQEKLSKVDKLAGLPGAKSEKVEKATALMEAAKLEWESEAKLAFAKYETMDRSRLEFLKNCCDCFIDLQGQLLEKNTTSHLSLITSSNSFTPDADIARFCNSRISLANVNPEVSSILNDDTPSRKAFDHGTPNRANFKYGPSSNLTSPNAIQLFTQPLVDSEGYVVNEVKLDLQDSNDSFKIDEESPLKLRINLNETPIVEDDVDIATALKNVSEKLQKDTEMILVSSKNQRTRTQSSKTFSPKSTRGEIEFFVTERINALQKNGNVEKLLVTGEISLSHQSTALYGKRSVVFTNIDDLELVVTNDKFVEPSDRKGQYLVNLESIEAEAGSKIAILKYQVNTTHNPLSYIPVLAKGGWSVSDTLTQILIGYRLGPNCHILKGTSISILATFADGGDIGMLETEPFALYDSNEKCLIWEVVVTEETQCLRAAIPTSSAITPKSIMVKFSANQLFAIIECDEPKHCLLESGVYVCQ